MEHVVDMLDALQGVTGEKGADESVSEEQHKAMEAAAHGESKLGIPEKVGKEFASKDASIDGLKDYLKSKGVADDVIGEACDMVSGMPPNALDDADETEEEKAEREKREKEAHDADVEAARKEVVLRMRAGQPAMATFAAALSQLDRALAEHMERQFSCT